MNVRELIALLEHLPQEAEVYRPSTGLDGGLYDVEIPRPTHVRCVGTWRGRREYARAAAGDRGAEMAVVL